MTNNQKGSEWRRWDLRLNTACSYDYSYNAVDADNSLVEAIKAAELAAVAITDHFIIDKDRINNLRRLLPEVVFFPGVELRTDKGNTNIHVILIFDIDIDLNILVESFNVFKREKGKEPNDNAKTYWDYKDIVEFATRHCALISIHAGSKTNGVDDKITNRLEHNQAVKEEYAKTVHIFEMGKPEDIAGYKQHVFPLIGERPLIICSDNHDPRSYNPTYKLWIKADPTFNGLKQIIYEPEERICISETKPQTKSPYQVIESIAITDNDFQSEPIVFNDKLNCIIGGKSTGKSILLHNMARAISPKQVVEKCEISMGKKGDISSKPLTLEIDESKLKVMWADGNTTSGQTIVYIPQTYLNRLVDSVQETTEIDEIIEKVLLDRKDSDGKKFSLKKDELRAFIDSVKSENTNKILEIIRLHKRISELTEQITELGGKDPVSKELAKLKEEREKLSKELNIQEDDIKKYDVAVSNIEIQTALISKLNREIGLINSLAAIIQQVALPLEISEETKSKINEAAVTIITVANQSWASSKVAIISAFEKKLGESQKSCNESISVRDELKSTIESSNRIKELAKKITKESEKLKAIESKETEKQTKQSKLDEMVDQVASAYVDLQTKYEEFAAYIKANTINDNSGLQYDVLIPLRQNDFLAKWSELYRATSSQNRTIINVDVFSPDKYNAALLISIIKKTLNGELITLKAGSDPEQALRNILDDWYNIKYIVKMGNDSIDVMSPGKKLLCYYSY